jgi:hypothetical protein
MHFGAGQAEAGDRKAARASFEQAHRLIGDLQRQNILPFLGIFLTMVVERVYMFTGRG